MRLRYNFGRAFVHCTPLPNAELPASQVSHTFVEEIILPHSRNDCRADLIEQETKPLKDHCRKAVFYSASKGLMNFIFDRSEIFTQAR